MNPIFPGSFFGLADLFVSRISLNRPTRSQTIPHIGKHMLHPRWLLMGGCFIYFNLFFLAGMSQSANLILIHSDLHLHPFVLVKNRIPIMNYDHLYNPQLIINPHLSSLNNIAMYPPTRSYQYVPNFF